MSLTQTAVRGVAWTMAFNWVARAIGLVGTLVLTRFLAPQAMGEVQVAFVLVITAHQFSLLGLGHYVVAKPDAGREAAFHATVMTLVTGVLAIGGAVLVRDWLGPRFDAPAATRYLPWLAFGVALDRLTFVPSRVLVRDMRFRTNAMVRTAGELAFPVVAVALAMRGHGGWALVWANVARCGVRSLATAMVVDPREWIVPSRLSLGRTREILSFGVPNGISTMAGFAARYWDCLIIARLFGPAELGLYQLAYNLSDLPSNQVGDHIGDVLLPSFARLPPERRGPALARAVRLLGLVMFPLAIGMGVMGPTIVDVVLAPSWHEVGDRVAILAILSAVYPLGFAVHSYLNAANHPRWVMVLGVLRTVALLGSLALLGWWGGPLWACVGVGLAYGAYALAGMALVARLEHMPARPLFRALVGPLAACAPMVLVVLAARAALRSLDVTAAPVFLAVELVAGAASYVGAALLLAPAVSWELLDLLRSALLGRRGWRASAVAESEVAG